MSRTRTLTAAFAIGRMAFGVGLLAIPDRMSSRWIGDDARRLPVQIALRAVGGRDVAIAAGTLAALAGEGSPRPWLAAAALSDMCDVAATLMTPPGMLPANARWGTVALGGGSALAGAALLVALDR
jgi:hypothetical protein